MVSRASDRNCQNLFRFIVCCTGAPVWRGVCAAVCLSGRLFVWQTVCLECCLTSRLSVCLVVCLSGYVSVRVFFFWTVCRLYGILHMQLSVCRSIIYALCLYVCLSPCPPSLYICVRACVCVCLCTVCCVCTYIRLLLVTSAYI